MDHHDSGFVRTNDQVCNRQQIRESDGLSFAGSGSGLQPYQTDDHLAETFHPIDKDPSGLSPHEPGAKLDDGKVMAAVLEDFALALMAVAEVGTFGAKKYSRGGWQSVKNGEQRYTDALWRHLLKGRHEAIDPDSNLTHAAHAAWNALAVLELALRREAGFETTRKADA